MHNRKKNNSDIKTRADLAHLFKELLRSHGIVWQTDNRAKIRETPKPVNRNPSNMFEWVEEQINPSGSDDINTQISMLKHGTHVYENNTRHDEILELANYLKGRKDRTHHDQANLKRAIRIVDNKPVESYLSVVPSSKAKEPTLMENPEAKESTYSMPRNRCIRTTLLGVNILIKEKKYTLAEKLLVEANERHPYSLRCVEKYLEVLYIQDNRDMFDIFAERNRTLFSNGIVPTWDNFEITTCPTQKPPKTQAPRKRSRGSRTKTSDQKVNKEQKILRSHVQWRQNNIAAAN